MNPSEVGPFVSKIRAVINEIGKYNLNSPFSMLSLTLNARYKKLYAVFMYKIWPKHLHN